MKFLDNLQETIGSAWILKSNKTCFSTVPTTSQLHLARPKVEHIYLLEPKEYTITKEPEWPAAFNRTEEDFRGFIARCQSVFTEDKWLAFLEKKHLWLILSGDGSNYVFSDSIDIDAVCSGRASDLVYIWLGEQRVRAYRDDTGIHVREGKHRAYVARKYGYIIPVAVMEDSD